MARKRQFPPSGTQAINAVIDVSTYEKFTVVAAATAVISLSFDGGASFLATGTVTVPAAGYATISDLPTHIKCDHVCSIVGLYGHDGE